MNTLAKRLLFALNRSGLTKTDLWKGCGLSSGAISHWFREDGTKELKGKNLICAAKILGVNSDWLSTGKGDITESDSGEYGVTLCQDKNSVPIPIFDAEGSMGIGKALPDHDTVVGTIHLNETWVRRTLSSISSPKNLAVLSACGDSMSPTFNDGDLLLIDKGVAEINLDAVYVLAFNNELFVKRIQRRMDGSVVIKSDNPLYDPHIVQNGEREILHVLGRVVWAWNGKKL